MKMSFSLFETSQSLFWASFGLVDLMSFELTGSKEFTRFWALLMFGSYSVINVIVLLNMLIAMMSNSYQIISVSFLGSLNVCHMMIENQQYVGRLISINEICEFLLTFRSTVTDEFLHVIIQQWPKRNF